jgi:hypothetical protein
MTNGGCRHRKPVAGTVATEVLLLRPTRVAPAATVEEAGLWPVFVLVISERPSTERSSATQLFEMLNRPKHGGELNVVSGRCRWSVLDPRIALLKVELEAEAPERFAVEIIVPAHRVLGILDVVARGATIGVTTSRRAARLGARPDIRRALPEIVLFSCQPSTELAAIADLLPRVMPD